MIDVQQAGEHVRDAEAFHVPQLMWRYLPDVMKGEHPHPGSIPLPELDLFGYQLQLTKFMVLELVAGPAG